MDIRVNIKDRHLLDTMLEHMPVGVALYDAQDLRLLAANPLYYKLLDTYLDPAWHEGRTAGHSIVEWLPGEQVANVVAILRTVAETGISHRISEYAFPFPEHGMTYWNWCIDPIFDDGRISQLVITLSDVTAEVKARQQAEQDQTVISQANTAIAAEHNRLQIIETVARSLRESLDIQHISRAAIDAIYNHFRLKGIHIHVADPVQKALHLVHLNDCNTPDQAHWLPYFQHIPYDADLFQARAYKLREPFVIEDLAVESLTGKLSRRHPLAPSVLNTGIHGFVCIPLWFKDYFEGALTAVFYTPIQKDGPEVQVLTGCGTYLAAALAHARLHAAVKNERARLRSILDQLPEGVLMIEASDRGQISYANPAADRISGYPLTSLIGTPLTQHSPTYTVTDMGGQPKIPEMFVDACIEHGEAVSNREVVVTRPDGTKAVLLTSAAPIRAENGTITGAVTVFQDITERKSIEQQKNEFVSIASHELRTPITAIQGFAEILQIMTANGISLDAPRSLGAISNIIDQSERLTQLIDEMLDITRIEKAQLLLNPATHDLVATVRHTLESLSTTSGHHQFHLVLDGLHDHDTLMGYFDENRIEQVLSNLINNAIKYSPDADKIEVGLRALSMGTQVPSQALIWVKDYGIGIAPDELPHIFERFHRASNVNRSISGLGLGLYLAKELVTRHGGRIWAESTQGAGSTFFVTLPLARRE